MKVLRMQIFRNKNQQLVGEEQVRHLLELVPHADFIDIQGAEHMAAGDDNDVFTQTLGGFIGGLAVQHGSLPGDRERKQ